MCGCLSRAPYWGPSPQPRHVSWLGIELATLRFAGRHSVHWATPARADVLICFKILFMHVTQIPSEVFCFHIHWFIHGYNFKNENCCVLRKTDKLPPCYILEVTTLNTFRFSLIFITLALRNILILFLVLFAAFFFFFLDVVHIMYWLWRMRI